MEHLNVLIIIVIVGVSFEQLDIVCKVFEEFDQCHTKYFSMSQLMKEFKLIFPLPLFACMKTNKSVNVGESGLCNLGCVCIT